MAEVGVALSRVLKVLLWVLATPVLCLQKLSTTNSLELVAICIYKTKIGYYFV